MDLICWIHGVREMNRKMICTVFISAMVTVCLIGSMVLPAAAESQVAWNSQYCVNGYCTVTGTGSPGPYGWPDHDHRWYYQYPQYSGYPDYQNGYRYYCSPYRTAQYRGYLSAGQYRVYGFRIGGDRTYIEWILNGGCGYRTSPVMMSMGPNEVYSWRQTSCGADFDIYVYQNRYPCSSCRADRWDTSRSSNAYVGWANPCTGCYYSVVVYCRSGSGYYDLTSNSYVNNCWYPYDSSGPVMMSSVEQAMTSGSDNILMLSESEPFEVSNVIWDEDGSSPGTGTLFPVSGGGTFYPSG